MRTNRSRGEVDLTYDNLLFEADQQGIYTYEKSMPQKLKGLYKDSVICINKQIYTSIEKACILSEELGHYYTSTGNILNQKDVRNRKQEYRARSWGYEYLVPLSKLVEAGQAGIEGRHCIAEWLDVTEEFLQQTIDHYQRKYGLYITYQNYLLYFEPLSICKL